MLLKNPNLSSTFKFPILAYEQWPNNKCQFGKIRHFVGYLIWSFLQKQTVERRFPLSCAFPQLFSKIFGQIFGQRFFDQRWKWFVEWTTCSFARITEWTELNFSCLNLILIFSRSELLTLVWRRLQMLQQMDFMQLDSVTRSVGRRGRLRQGWFVFGILIF